MGGIAVYRQAWRRDVVYLMIVCLSLLRAMHSGYPPPTPADLGAGRGLRGASIRLAQAEKEKIFEADARAKRRRLRRYGGFRSDDDVAIPDDLTGLGRSQEEMMKIGPFTRGDKRMMLQTGKHSSKIYNYVPFSKHREKPKKLVKQWKMWKKHSKMIESPPTSYEPSPEPIPELKSILEKRKTGGGSKIMFMDELNGKTSSEGAEEVARDQGADRNGKNRDDLQPKKQANKDDEDKDGMKGHHRVTSGGLFSSSECGESDGDTAAKARGKRHGGDHSRVSPPPRKSRRQRRRDNDLLSKMQHSAGGDFASSLGDMWKGKRMKNLKADSTDDIGENIDLNQLDAKAGHPDDEYLGCDGEDETFSGDCPGAPSDGNEGDLRRVGKMMMEKEEDEGKSGDDSNSAKGKPQRPVKDIYAEIIAKSKYYKRLRKQEREKEEEDLQWLDAEFDNFRDVFKVDKRSIREEAESRRRRRRGAFADFSLAKFSSRPVSGSAGGGLDVD